MNRKDQKMKPRYMRTKYTYKINWGVVGRGLLTLVCWAIVILLLIYAMGCVQREYRYNLITGEIHVKTNYFASKVQVDNIYLESPTGWIVEFNRILQENQSVKLIVPPYFMVETESK